MSCLPSANLTIGHDTRPHPQTSLLLLDSTLETHCVPKLWRGGGIAWTPKLGPQVYALPRRRGLLVVLGGGGVRQHLASHPLATGVARLVAARGFHGPGFEGGGLGLVAHRLRQPDLQAWINGRLLACRATRSSLSALLVACRDAFGNSLSPPNCSRSWSLLRQQSDPSDKQMLDAEWLRDLLAAVVHRG